MSLPKIDYPIYELKLLSVDNPVKFRPFLVKEQKLLMMAFESNETKTVIQTIKQVMRNCCLDNIDIDNLPLVDIELFYLNLRARSVSEIIDILFKCKNLVEEKECGMVIEISVDLLKDVGIENKNDSNKIMLSDNIGILMKYPTIDLITALESDDNISEKVLMQCIGKIFDEDEIYDPKTANENEIIEFLENLSAAHYNRLVDFVKNIPTLSYKKSIPCPKCKHVHEVKLEGLDDFFS